MSSCRGSVEETLPSRSRLTLISVHCRHVLTVLNEQHVKRANLPGGNMETDTHPGTFNTEPQQGSWLDLRGWYDGSCNHCGPQVVCYRNSWQIFWSPQLKTQRRVRERMTATWTKLIPVTVTLIAIYKKTANNLFNVV